MTKILSQHRVSLFQQGAGFVALLEDQETAAELALSGSDEPGAGRQPLAADRQRFAQPRLRFHRAAGFSQQAAKRVQRAGLIKRIPRMVPLLEGERFIVFPA